MNQKVARRKYKALIAAVKATIDAADPIGLLELGAPSDTAGPIANYDGSGNLAGDALMDSPNGLSTARAEA
jgi:hypothetical protein